MAFVKVRGAPVGASTARVRRWGERWEGVVAGGVNPGVRWLH